jgi:dsRNA-specific ribonuclease
MDIVFDKNGVPYHEDRVFEAPRDEGFTKMLVDIFVKSKLKEKYMTVLCDQASIDIYKKVFTAESFDPVNNYQLYETLGDATFKHFIIWYMYERFPGQLDPSTLSRLWIKWGSKDMMYEIADRLGFWPYISAGLELDKNKEMKNTRQNKRKALLEDVFEAFIGATEYILDRRFRKGVGNAIVSNILKDLYDKEDIRTDREALFDAKTRLKEYFDKNTVRAKLGSLEYVSTQDENTKIHTVQIFRNVDTEFEKHVGPTHSNANTYIQTLICNELKPLRTLMENRDNQVTHMKKQLDMYSLSISPSGFTVYKKQKVKLSEKFSNPKKIDAEQAAAKNAIEMIYKMTGDKI